MTKNNEKNAGATAAAAAAASGRATFAWEKRLRRMVDEYTFEEYQHVDSVPRIEDHMHENLDVVVAVPDALVSASDGNTLSSVSKPSSGFSLCDSFKSKSTIATSSTASSTLSSATNTTSSSILSPLKSKPPGVAAAATATTTTKRSNAIPSGSMSKSHGSSHSTGGSTSTPKQSRRKMKPGSDHSSSRSKSRNDGVLSPRSSSKKKSLTEGSDHSSSRRSKTSISSGGSDHSSPRKSSSASPRKKLLSPSSTTPKTKKKLVKKISSSTTDSSSKIDSESNHSSTSGSQTPTTPRSKKTPKSSSSSSSSSTPRKKVSSGGDHSSPTKKKPGTPSKSTKNTAVQGDFDIPSLFTASFPPTSSSTTNSPRSAKTTPRTTNKKTISSSSSLSSSLSSPLKKKSNGGGLGAFLHQNAVEQFTDKILRAASSSDDGMSVGSKSISSKSVSELSHAERSKAEDSLPRKSWWKSRRATTTSNLRNQMFAVRSDSAKNLNEDNDDLSRSGRTNGMLSIDEMSVTDFSEAPPVPASHHDSPNSKSNKSPIGRKSPTSSSRISPKNNSPVSQGGDLGTFLQKSYFSKPRDDDDDDDDKEEAEVTMAMLNGSADDMQSVASASTFGHRSISELSTAEQSRSEQRLRDRSKKRKDSIVDSTTTNAPTSSTVEKSEENSTLEKQKEPEEIQVQALGTRASQPLKSCLRPSKYCGGGDSSSDAINDTNNDSMKLDDLAVDPTDNKLIKFKDGHSQKEIPDLTDSLYDILFYTEEQLADFRYEAFLEECGLDVDEFM